MILSWTQSQKSSLELRQWNYFNKNKTKKTTNMDTSTKHQYLTSWWWDKKKIVLLTSWILACVAGKALWFEMTKTTAVFYSSVPLSKSKPNQNFTFQDKSNSESIFSIVGGYCFRFELKCLRWHLLSYGMTFYNCTWCKKMDRICFYQLILTIPPPTHISKCFLSMDSCKVAWMMHVDNY